jgi:pyruvate formate-lyase/glycerol dehydratase family glycyl radical enzyme
MDTSQPIFDGAGDSGNASGIGSTERIRRLNRQLHSTPQTICLHRARAYTKVFAETEGEPMVLRRAKALTRSLEELPVSIGPDELIVGKHSCRLRSVPVAPECHGGWLQWDLENLPKRPQDPFDVPPDQMAEARAILESWRGRTLYDAWSKSCPEDIVAKAIGTGWADACCGVFFTGYHFTPPWERILGDGLRSFEQQVRTRLNGLDRTDPQDMGKEHFLHAMLAAVEGARHFAGRYAAEAERRATEEPDPTRKEELLRIAEACRRVPYEGARSFYEAVQALWLVHVVLHVEGTGPVYTIGRFDKYMLPFYQADLERGAITREDAQELIEHLFINMTNLLFMYDTQTAQGSAGFTQYQVLSLGGVDETGADASNELSWLCLDAVEAVRTTQPDIVLLCHPRETPYPLKMKAAELVGLGLGMPKFMNTETIKTQLMEWGYSHEEASVGWIQGCSEPHGPGAKEYGHTAAGMINLPLALEAVLFNGRKRTPGQAGSGALLGVETGDPTALSSYEEFYEAFKQQVAKQINDAHVAASYMELANAQGFPLVFQSVMTADCIERGLPCNAGGARIPVGPGMAFAGGWATVADSLAAIKKLVYEEKRLSMADVVRMIDADFEGYETERQTLINDAPKFGNDIDYVDDIAKDIFQWATREVKKYTGIYGNPEVPGTNVSVSYIILGTLVWATPDGRKAGTPFSDNVGPMDQRDKLGPVAHLNSVTKLGLERQFGSIHNMYLGNAGSSDGVHKMIDLVDMYHARGGHHLQINCVDKEILLDAQKHPERYPTLMVRVAGYVAYFVDLSRAVQDQIIGRTSVML